MKQSNIFSISKPKGYLILALWVFIIGVAGIFIFKDALPYFAFTEEALGRWWNYKWSLIGHISGGLLAIAIGPFQFWKAFRTRYLAIHRMMGKVYLIAIMIGVTSATYLAWTSGLKINANWALALQGLAFAWFVTTAMAYISIMRKRIQQHQEWMVRSYVVTFAFITFRFLNDAPMEDLIGISISGTSFLWFSWSVPLLITELILNWNKR